MLRQNISIKYENNEQKYIMKVINFVAIKLAVEETPVKRKRPMVQCTFLSKQSRRFRKHGY